MAGPGGKAGSRGLGLVAGCLLTLSLVACSPYKGSDGTEVAIGRFTGGVAADEPRAAQMGARALNLGGNAADAAAAIYFMLAATYPNAASLGGGGNCVIYDPASERKEAIDFLPRAPTAGGSVAIPMNVRGMSYLQGRFGRLRWETLLAPAEEIARLGGTVNRAYAQALVASGPDLAGEAGLAGLVRGPQGLKTEGELLQQLDLATTLARLRAVGPNDLYTGQLAATYLAAANAAGGKLTAEELARAGVVSGPPVRLKYDNFTMYFNNLAGGQMASKLFDAVSDNPALAGVIKGRIKGEAFPAALADVFSAAGAGDAVPGTGTTGFAAIDVRGQAVACTVGLGRPFGVRAVARGTGIVMAGIPVAGDETLYQAAMVGGFESSKFGAVAATGTGGVPAAAVMAESLLIAVVRDQTARSAVAAPRLFRSRASPDLNYEAGLDPALLNGFKAAGQNLVEVKPFGRANLLYCANGLPRSPETCRFAADPRGFGLAIGDEF